VQENLQNHIKRRRSSCVCVTNLWGDVVAARILQQQHPEGEHSDTVHQENNRVKEEDSDDYKSKEKKHREHSYEVNQIGKKSRAFR
jgi:hypothetical protein